MSKIESRNDTLRLVLPPAFTPPPGVVLPFVNVRLIGNRAIIAGHGPQNPEGPLAQPLGKVGHELTIEQGYVAAKLTALSMLSYLKRRSAISAEFRIEEIECAMDDCARAPPPLRRGEFAIALGKILEIKHDKRP